MFLTNPVGFGILTFAVFDFQRKFLNKLASIFLANNGELSMQLAIYLLFIPSWNPSTFTCPTFNLWISLTKPKLCEIVNIFSSLLPYIALQQSWTSFTIHTFNALRFECYRHRCLTLMKTKMKNTIMKTAEMSWAVIVKIYDVDIFS